MSNIRVRFAPSPTGPLHIGGVRTALYNYLFAKKHNGRFILRIEDTDQKRFVPGAVEYIREALEWAGIRPDEGYGYGGNKGPYRQSERPEIYERYVRKLLDEGKAYYAFDTPEALEQLREKYQSEGKVFTYNHEVRQSLNNSLALPPEEVQAKLNAGEPYTVRFKIPEGRTLVLNDLIRGEIRVNTSELDDKVLMKSDGLPTYHLANIVDDHLMEITHVIRGEEWLPSLPLHILLYEAFDWEPPQFAHLPLILKPQGKGKLSKRDGAKGGFPVFPLQWTDPQTGEKLSGYREEGYLPQAFINMLALLGWNPGDEREIFSMEELIKAFDLSRINKSGARFDPDKAKWIQHQHFQALPGEAMLEYVLPVLEEKTGMHLRGKSMLEYVRKVLDTVRERLTFPADIWEWASFFFEAPKEFNPKAVKKQWKTQTPGILSNLKEILKEISPWEAPVIKEKISGWITENGLSFGKVLQPWRLALAGDLKGPDLFVMAELLGKEEVLKRIDFAISRLGSKV